MKFLMLVCEAVIFASRNGETTVTSGSRIADDEQIVGFDVIECPDLHRATRLIATHQWPTPDASS